MGGALLRSLGEFARSVAATIQHQAGRIGKGRGEKLGDFRCSESSIRRNTLRYCALHCLRYAPISLRAKLDTNDLAWS
jgi:hypothetical protein